MKPFAKQRFLIWTPRILSLVFVCFLALFALDVFNQYTGMAVVVPFLIHLVPSLLLLGVVALAWKFPLVGTVAFGGFGIWYIYQVGLDRHWSWYLAVTGPALVVGILYFLSWVYRKKDIEKFMARKNS